MKLGLVMLDSVSTLNNLKYLNQMEVIPGETAVVMFQLVDASNKQRYMPISGAIVDAVIQSVNNANTLSKSATQPFPADDRSIWQFSLNATETQTMAGINMSITLTEGASIKKARGDSTIIVAPQSPYQC